MVNTTDHSYHKKSTRSNSTDLFAIEVPAVTIPSVPFTTKLFGVPIHRQRRNPSAAILVGALLVATGLTGGVFFLWALGTNHDGKENETTPTTTSGTPLLRPVSAAVSERPSPSPLILSESPTSSSRSNPGTSLPTSSPSTQEPSGSPTSRSRSNLGTLLPTSSPTTQEPSSNFISTTTMPPPNGAPVPLLDESPTVPDKASPPSIPSSILSFVMGSPTANVSLVAPTPASPSTRAPPAAAAMSPSAWDALFNLWTDTDDDGNNSTLSTLDDDAEPSLMPGHFTYDLNDPLYGPDNWHRINMTGTYFSEFGQDGYGTWKGHLQHHVANATLNRCRVAGKQSPIDLYKTPATECTAAHQIRTRAGSFRLGGGDIRKRIEPSKLRLLLNRRPCTDYKTEQCKRPRPPMADFPNYSSSVTHLSDLLNVDIKVPGEHRIRGETFDAEIQMLHIHLNASRLAYIAIPVRATQNATGYNQEYQAVLDEFQLLYDKNQARCNGKRRSLAEASGKDSLWERSSRHPRRRQQQQQPWKAFNPYRDFLKTVFFYRYQGSSTEPPCFPLTWFVMTTPLVISLDQLRQTRHLLFTHVNRDCEHTSVAAVTSQNGSNEQSVARPIQPLGILRRENQTREVALCQEGDFPPDR